MEERLDPREARERLSDIPTRWSVLRGAQRDALDYLFRAYGRAITGYIRGRLARGDFRPLTADDADDLLQEFFLRLGKTDWLSKPDPSRGRFRPFLVRRLVFFLRERRAEAAGKKQALQGEAADAAIEAAAEPDPLEEAFERDWKAATVRECMRRITARNASWGAALDADLRRENESDADIAARLGLTLESFRSVLKRSRAAFRDLYRLEETRLDGFGGDAFADAG